MLFQVMTHGGVPRFLYLPPVICRHAEPAHACSASAVRVAPERSQASR